MENKLFDSMSICIVEYGIDITKKRCAILKDLFEKNGGKVVNKNDLQDGKLPSIIVTSKNITLKYLLNYFCIDDTDWLDKEIFDIVIDCDWITDTIKRKEKIELENYQICLE